MQYFEKTNLRYIVNNGAVLPRSIQKKIQVSHWSYGISQVKITSGHTRYIV